MRQNTPPGDLWARVEELVAAAPSPADLRAHRLETLAAHRLRTRGEQVPPDLAIEEREAALVSLAAPSLLRRVRAALDGPLVLLKGPEVAAAYPAGALRRYGDIDLLVEDPGAAQAELVRRGFALVGDPDLYRDIHHVRPVAFPGIPIPIELHTHPKWVGRSAPPTLDRLLAGAIPSATGVEGMLAPAPSHHAVLLAVHSWAHEPLRRLRDLVDIAALGRFADADEMGDAAAEWGVDRLWRTTSAVLAALFEGRRTPAALYLWAQNVRRARERTVLEQHLERWLSDFWAMPPHSALARVPATLTSEIRPSGGEQWAAKVRRSALAVANAPRRRSEHEEQVDARAGA